jgi:phage gp46-like protein
MIDLALTNNNYFDIDFENGDFKYCYDLKTAIIMSIFCEKRADPLQVPQVDQRRGDFTNQFNLVNGYEVGSLYWLYTSQNKIDEANKEDLQDTINESLQWLIDDNYLNDIECNVEITDNQYVINIATTDTFNAKTSYTF